MATNQDNNSAESPAPPRLIAALRQTQSGRVFVPRTADEAVLRAAREHLAPTKPHGRSSSVRWLRWPAFATACLLLCAVAYRITRTPSSPNSTLTHVREDLNRDGRVDILDALLLARTLQAGDQPNQPWLEFDFNGDGVLDNRDVDTVAAEAVKLEKGSRS